jgi:single-stranded-DNA-specific exonuclease
LLNATTLAAVATVCDVVPLHGENRVLVHHGLKALSAEPPLGLSHLIRLAGIADKKRLTAGDIGFTLGPRLNACGRLGTARLGVELLTTRDPERACKLAEYLDEQNKQRQLLERRMLARARELADQQSGSTETAPPALVLADDYSPERWHPGILGIVAGRMAERYHCPCILLSFAAESGTGSGRSTPGFDLYAAVAQAGNRLNGYGGHHMAVGVRLNRSQLDSFREDFYRHCDSCRPPASRVSELRLDAEVSLPMLNHGLIQALEVLEPFGLANPSPVLTATNLQVVGEPKKVGGGERHLSFQVQPADGGAPRKAIGFDMADRVDELMSEGGKCCLAFTPEANEFRGYVSVDLRLRDLQPGPKIRVG